LSQPLRTSIPKIFRCDATGANFERCIACDQPVSQLDGYVIEKAFKSYQGLSQYNTLFEYAMCMPCAQMMRSQLSIQSRTSIDQFFGEHIDFNKHYRLCETGTTDIEAWLNQCAVDQTPVNELVEFQIFGSCQGSELVLENFPLLLGGPALDRLVQLLSNQTLDDLQRFTENLIDGPPEFADLLSKGPRVFI
jgi:hypothetical protein